jgi:penicillin-binding protein 1C
MRKRTKRKKHFASPLRIAIAVAGGGAVALALLLFYFIRSTPPLESIVNVQVAQSTKIFDRTGRILLYEVAEEEKRTVVPFAEIPQAVKDATIAIEDERFYSESAVSIRGILRATVVNLLQGRIVQGGSTITQQLARNAFLTSERTPWRKIRELILAIKLSRRYSKDEILELYLNEVPYGSNLYGIEAASRAYFGKSVREATFAEAALLAALPKAPSYYSPWGSHTNELLARTQFILKKMRRLGMIDEEELSRALATKLVFLPRTQAIEAPHFTLAVQEYVSATYGEETVLRGGLTVITTLDAELQRLAEKVVAEGAARNEELYEGKNAALVAEDANTGEILALVGSRDYFDVAGEGNFNVATQGLRQPGSALKPFVYLAAFKKGYAPESVLFDVPTEFTAGDPACPSPPQFEARASEAKDDCFHPKNFDDKFRGPTSFRVALGQSINVPAVKVLYLAGIADTLETLSRFGIGTLTEPRRFGLSLVLGGGEVRLIELVGAYATLAQEGVRHPQTFVREVRDAKGNVLESFKEAGESVEDPQWPRLINDILTDTEVRAGLFQNSLDLTVFPGYEVALKTGTTDDYRDAWAIGYTPSLVVGVWAGNNDNAPMQAQGSSILAAVPIWSAFMKEALNPARVPQETFPRPEPVVVLKPLLRGEHAPGGLLHSELYWIDRRNPDGLAPQQPERDPQFPNWETAVLAWAQANVPPQGASGGTAAPAEPIAPSLFNLTIAEPAPGTFIGDTARVVADIRAGAGIAKVRLYFNNGLIQEVGGPLGQIYRFESALTPQNPLLQNVIKVVAEDAAGKTKEASVIVYK